MSVPAAKFASAMKSWERIGASIAMSMASIPPGFMNRRSITCINMQMDCQPKGLWQSHARCADHDTQGSGRVGGELVESDQIVMSACRFVT